ncbi:MAG: CBS domain-containing protein, partial [Gaiellaceae bacterium]
SLRRLAEIELEPADRLRNGEPQVDETTSLRDALSVMLAAGSRTAAVRREDGGVAGSISLDRIAGLLSEER